MNFIILYNILLLLIFILLINIGFVVFIYSKYIGIVIIIFILIFIFWVLIDGYNSLINRTKFHKNIKENLSIVKKDFNKNQLNILDYGSGKDCKLAKYLNNENVWSADIMDSNNIKYTKIKNKLLPFKNKEFDLVIVSSVLHHCNDPKKILNELKRISKYILIIEDIPDKSIFPQLAYEITKSHFEFFNQSHNYIKNIYKISEWKKLMNDSILLKQKIINGNLVYGFMPHIFFIYKLI